jgi:hypothetical protein
MKIIYYTNGGRFETDTITNVPYKKLHRIDGPAIKHHKGKEEWYFNGKRHREDGPALIYPCGSRHWYKHGKKHREDGPAIIYSDGVGEYLLDDVEYSYEDWVIKTNPIAAEIFDF